MTQTTRYELIEAPQDPSEVLSFFTEQFLPLLDEFWEKHGKARYNTERWDIPPMDFTMLWQQRHFVIIMAYEGDEAVGFLLAMKLRPFLYNRQLLQIEPVYGRTERVTTGLTEYIFQHKKFFGVDDVVLPSFDDDPEPVMVPRQIRNYKVF